MEHKRASEHLRHSTDTGPSPNRASPGAGPSSSSPNRASPGAAPSSPLSERVKAAQAGWERSASAYFDVLLASPLTVAPLGSLVTGVARARRLSRRALDAWWGALGLPTRREQERAQHSLNELASRLEDLEERLRESHR